MTDFWYVVVLLQEQYLCEFGPNGMGVIVYNVLSSPSDNWLASMHIPKISLFYQKRPVCHLSDPNVIKSTPLNEHIINCKHTYVNFKLNRTK